MEQVVGRRPWHLWVVGVVSALWNAGGVYDFIMTNMHDAAYLAAYTPEQRDYFHHFPAWATAAWALGVWGALAGSLLLLAASRFAVHTFAVALVGLVGITVFERTAAMPASLDTPAMTAFTAAIWVITIALLAYAAWMRRRGVLR